MFFSKEKIIATHFIKSWLQHKYVKWFVLFLILLFAIALYTGSASFSIKKEQQENYEEASRKKWLENPDKHPHRMAHYGNFAFRKLDPLSQYESGLSAYLGNIIFLEAHQQNTANIAEASQHNSLLRWGVIDVSLLLQKIMPICIFLFGFQSVSTEKESGTLAIILSQNTTIKQFMGGKLLGLIVLVSVFYLIVGTMLMLSYGISQNFNLTSIEWKKIILFLVIHYAYLVLVCFITSSIAALNNSAQATLYTLFGIWIIWVVIMPKCTQAMAQFIYQTPSKTAFNAKISSEILKFGNSHNPHDVYFNRLKSKLLKKYKVQKVADLPFNYAGYIMANGEKISSTIYNNEMNKRHKMYEKQNHLHQLVSFINPYMAVKHLSMAFASTDYDAFKKFETSAENYRYFVSQKMNELQIKHISNTKIAKHGKSNAISKIHWQSIPAFSYQNPTVSEVVARQQYAILGLLLMFIVAFISFYFVGSFIKITR